MLFFSILVFVVNKTETYSLLKKSRRMLKQRKKGIGTKILKIAYDY